MKLLEKCTINEIKLLEKAGIYIEDKEYSQEDLKICETKIVEYIMNHSSKNNEIDKLQNQYSSIFRTIDVK